MLTQTAILLFAYFTIWYIIGVIIKNASIIDIGWGFGFVVVAIVGFVQNITMATGIITLLVTVWGLRLTIHIFMRNFGKPEDFRYANFRRSWGKTYYFRSYFQLFMFQAAMMFIISLPYVYANSIGEIRNLVLFIVGIIIWLFGFLFEAISDYQLKVFIQNENNKGKLIDTGLWKNTRHPNYFGEAVLWWGIFLMSLAGGAPWFTVIGPITITVLVRFVSGVPLLEKRLMKRIGYEEYVRKTNIFIPWFKKGGNDE